MLEKLLVNTVPILYLLVTDDIVQIYQRNFGLCCGLGLTWLRVQITTGPFFNP